jgi:hypothetical protein
MRDHTASRNYSPEREEFRREHARHRAWGLLQRHGERLHRLRRQRGQSCAHAPAPCGEGVAAEVTPPARKSRPTHAEQGDRDRHTEAARPPAPARPAAARVPPRLPAASTPHRRAPDLRPRPQRISHPSKRRHRPPPTIWERDLAIVRDDWPPAGQIGAERDGQARVSPNQLHIRPSSTPASGQRLRAPPAGVRNGVTVTSGGRATLRERRSGPRRASR